MNIQVKDKVGLPVEVVMYVVKSLLENRRPKDESFNYGFETHGVFGLINIPLPYPIQVKQSKLRKTAKSPIHIVIERHLHIF